MPVVLTMYQEPQNVKSLKKFAKVKSRVTRQFLLTKLPEGRLTWAKKYLKTNFGNVIFTDESRVTLDGSDGWTQGWVLSGGQSSYFYQRQRDGGGAMIEARQFGSTNLAGK